MLAVVHVMSAEVFREALQRVADGEDPELVYIETYANAARHEQS